MIDAEKIEELRGLLAAVEAFDQMETFDWFAKRSAELNLRAAIEPHYRSLLDLATANLARGGEGETEELCKRLEAKAKILAQANYRNDEELEAIALIRRLVRERDEAKDRAALAEKYERAAKVAADAFDEDNARLNSHATTAEAQVERLRAENERLRVALEESDKQQVWQDGFDAARKMVESVTSRATWGPKATLHDAYQLGMDAVKGVFKRADLRRARTALEGKTDGE